MPEDESWEWVTGELLLGPEAVLQIADWIAENPRRKYWRTFRGGLRSPCGYPPPEVFAVAASMVRSFSPEQPAVDTRWLGKKWEIHLSWKTDREQESSGIRAGLVEYIMIRCYRPPRSPQEPVLLPPPSWWEKD